MKPNHPFSRRSMLQLGVAGLATGPLFAGISRSAPKDNIRQSVCRWCYNPMPLEELAAGAAKIGLKSVELIGPEEYQVVKQYGLGCAVTWGAGPIHDCLNRKENHERCRHDLEKSIEFAASEKIPNVICFSGNRAEGLDDEEGLENCLVGIKPVVGLAEKKGVTIVMEALNSKVDHIGYMADHTEWVVRLVKRVGSPRFKLLYDIYHMQIMEGDMIRTIRDNHEYIAHYHTAGVPGRHEIDGSQEINYPAVIEAILETGYTGFLGQEFVPAGDPLKSLEEGFRICDV